MLRFQRDGWAIEVADARGQPLPKWFIDRPESTPEDDFYLKAFWDLSSTRSIGFGVGPIPWDQIVSYADRMGLEPDIAQGFVRIIQALDGTYLIWQEDERKKKSKTRKPGEKNVIRR